MKKISFFFFFKLAGPGLKKNLGQDQPNKTQTILYRARLSPAHAAGLMVHPDWLLCPCTVTSQIQLPGVIIFPCTITKLLACRTCTVHVSASKENEMGNKNEGKRITWNGGVVVHGAGGSWWHCCRGSQLWCQTLLLFLLSSALSCCMFPLFFVSPVNNVLASLQWLRGGAAGGGEEEDVRWYAGDAASVSLYFLLLSPAFCLCFCSSFTLLFFLVFPSAFLLFPYAFMSITFSVFFPSPWFFLLPVFSLFFFSFSLFFLFVFPFPFPPSLFSRSLPSLCLFFFLSASVFFPPVFLSSPPVFSSLLSPLFFFYFYKARDSPVLVTADFNAFNGETSLTFYC